MFLCGTHRCLLEWSQENPQHFSVSIPRKFTSLFWLKHVNLSWRVDSISHTLHISLFLSLCLMCESVFYTHRHPVHHKPFTRPVFAIYWQIDLKWNEDTVWLLHRFTSELDGLRANCKQLWRGTLLVTEVTCWPWNVSPYPLFQLKETLEHFRAKI